MLTDPPQMINGLLSDAHLRRTRIFIHQFYIQLHNFLP